MKQYVQHKSGQGEKWEIRDCGWNEDSTRPYWLVGVTNDRTHYVAFPKSEYILCDPPEEWEDVTGACEVDSYSNSVGEFLSIVHFGDCNVMYKKYGYQVRKIDGPHNGPCFIVERRKS